MFDVRAVTSKEKNENFQPVDVHKLDIYGMTNFQLETF